jgi:hypothetical protein
MPTHWTQVIYTAIQDLLRDHVIPMLDYIISDEIEEWFPIKAVLGHYLPMFVPPLIKFGLCYLKAFLGFNNVREATKCGNH